MNVMIYLLAHDIVEHIHNFQLTLIISHSLSDIATISFVNSQLCGPHRASVEPPAAHTCSLQVLPHVEVQ